MMTQSDNKYPMVDIGVNVVIPIPDVDKGKSDLLNLIGVVLEKTEHDLYRIGSKDGILVNLYSKYLRPLSLFLPPNKINKIN